MYSTQRPRRVGAAVIAVVALLLTTGAASALAAGSSYGPAPASFFYDDGEYAVFAGPEFERGSDINNCPPASDPDAHVVRTGAGTIHTQGSRDVASVRVYRLDDYDPDAFPFDGGHTPFDVLFAICNDDAEDIPVMVGDGTVWFNNTNCTPGVTGECFEPGSSWTGMNRLKATVHDQEGHVYDVKAFVRVAIDWPAGAPGAQETLLDMRLSIR